MHSITFELDELKPFLAPNGDAICVYVYGQAQIEFAAADDWRVASIVLDAGHYEPARSDADGEPRRAWIASSVEIDRAHPLWAPICETLNTRLSGRVDDAVRKHLEDAGAFRADPHAEHRHGHLEYGLAR